MERFFIKTMNKVAKGNRNQNRCRKILENNGWLVYVAPRQRYGPVDIWGLWDLIDYKDGYIKLIQVKSNYCSPSIKSKLRAFMTDGLFVIREVWVFSDYDREGPVIGRFCRTCATYFEPAKNNMANGMGIYCSIECYRIAQQKTKIHIVCEICRKEFIVSPIRRIARYCSRECFAKGLSEEMKGEKHPHWRGGTGLSFRYDLNTPDWQILRKRVFERDNFTCQNCGKTKCSLSVHHIIPYQISKDNSLENLKTLCSSCHTKEEWLVDNVFNKRIADAEQKENRGE